MDIDDTYGHMSNADMYKFIKENLDFDQMIWEFGDDTNPNWVHVSYVDPGSNISSAIVSIKKRWSSVGVLSIPFLKAVVLYTPSL